MSVKADQKNGFTLEIPNLSACRSWLGVCFRHHADLLREGDEARVVLVGKQERIIDPDTAGLYMPNYYK